MERGWIRGERKLRKREKLEKRNERGNLGGEIAKEEGKGNENGEKKDK